MSDFPEPLHIVVACGGTGGHVFPGLATAQLMRAEGARVTIWFSGRDVENATLNEWDGEIVRTGAKPLNLKNIFANVAAFWRCLRLMTTTRPDAVLAMGGYSCLSPVIAAKLCHVPVILHEANAVAGKAILFLARFADVVALSFADSGNEFTKTTTTVTGLPIRTSVLGQQPLESFEPAPDTFTILVTGGSQGAHKVNELSCAALCLLAPSCPGLRVIHQCGGADEAALIEQYKAAEIRACVKAFMPEMGRAYASADCVIARAGAATCFELCAAGLPSLLIPLPSALRDHQTANAKVLADGGGAILLPQAELTPELLAGHLSSLMHDPDKCRFMHNAMLRMAQPEAVRHLANLVFHQALRRKI